MARTLARVLLGTLLILATLTGPAALAGPGGAAVQPEPGHPWFGPALDIHGDTPQQYAGLVRHAAGRVALAVVVLAAAVLLWLRGVPTGPSPDLPLGRLLVVAAAGAVALAALTTCWRPLGAVLAPVLEPLGRVPLVVLLGHVLLLLLVADLGAPGGPLADALDGPLAGTAVDVVALGVLVAIAWWRVRARARRPATGAG